MKNTQVKVRARFSYVHLFEPYAMADGQEPKYSVSLLIDKNDTEAIEQIKRAIEAAKELGVATKKTWKGKVPARLDIPLRDGDTDKDDDAYKGHYFINAKNKRKPKIVDRRAQVIIDESELYSGCYGYAVITFYPYGVVGNNGIAAAIDGVQKLEEGDPLAGGLSSDAFADEGSEEGGFFE